MRDAPGPGLRPGDPHYRAYVGPPEDYDLVAAMSFGLLTSLGLRARHRVLDIGCGSLRVGRLLIPYLERGHYVGVEPNEWLVEEGIEKEIGASLLRIKEPVFYVADSAREVGPDQGFDFALAQSIFSHTGRDLLADWLREVARLLAATGALVATFCQADTDFTGSGWIYPECVHFRLETLAHLAGRFGLRTTRLNWLHPRQTWLLMAKPGFDAGWIPDATPHWNAWLAHALGSPKR
jgi:SAM-dependent methyltransferase